MNESNLQELSSRTSSIEDVFRERPKNVRMTVLLDPELEDIRGSVDPCRALRTPQELAGVDENVSKVRF